MSTGEVKFKQVHGWECDCMPEVDEDGHLIAHHVHLCPGRRRVTTVVATVPGWKIPRAPVRQEAARADLPGPDVRMRLATAAELPPAAGRLLAAAWRAGLPAAATYARGWAHVRVKVDDGAGAGDRGRSKERRTVDVPAPVESVAVRCSRFVVVWTRKQGGGWTLTERYGVGGRVIAGISMDRVKELLGGR